MYHVNYIQTFIIMYYDNITQKMIPGIFTVINFVAFVGIRVFKSFNCFSFVKVLIS